MRWSAAARRSCAAGGERDGGGGGVPAGGADGALPGVPVRPAGRAPPGERPPLPPAPVPRVGCTLVGTPRGGEAVARSGGAPQNPHSVGAVGRLPSQLVGWM